MVQNGEMAEAVSSRVPALERGVETAGWWPADRLICSYLLAWGLLIAVFWRQVPGAGWLLCLHVAGMATLAVAAGREAKEGSVLWLFRHCYPLLYVAACYREMSVLIPAIRGKGVDAALARLDYAIWGVHPTVWLERLQRPWLTESLQIAYALFLPGMLVVVAVLWLRKRLAEFRYNVFLLSLGFLTSYAGYFLAPVRGPRFLLEPWQGLPLEGLWSFPFLRHWLDVLEAAHYDCFPSGHTEIMLLVWWSSRQVSRNLFRVLGVYTLVMIVSAVYLRYHYTVDVAAGAVLAALLWRLAPRLYGGEKGRGLGTD